MNRITTAAALCLLTVLCSCAAPRGRAPGTPTVLHVVLVKLRQPEHAERVLRDVVAVLNQTRTARRFDYGYHFESGRAEVDRDYDLALIMEFEGPAPYSAYLASDAHQELLRVWRPHITALRIFDLARQTPIDPNALAGRPRILGP